MKMHLSLLLYLTEFENKQYYSNNHGIRKTSELYRPSQVRRTPLHFNNHPHPQHPSPIILHPLPSNHLHLIKPPICHPSPNSSSHPPPPPHANRQSMSLFRFGSHLPTLHRGPWLYHTSPPYVNFSSWFSGSSYMMRFSITTCPPRGSSAARTAQGV